MYLSDFGISKDPPPGGIIAMGKFVGNLDYVAPEQIEGRALDGRADLYALACAGFELLCGSPPFGQDPGLTVMYAQLYAPPPAATARRADLPAAGGPGSGHGAGEEPGRPLRDLRPVRRRAAGSAGAAAR